MQLEIKDTMIVRDIQEQFHRLYPNLWIEFYYNPFYETSHTKAEKIKPVMSLSNLCNWNGTRFIQLSGNRSVAELKNDFCETLGLETKVFRKSGNVWVGTLLTDSWSLHNQNSIGEQIFND